MTDKEHFREFRKIVDHRLIDIEQTKTWLCKQIHEDCGLYADTALLGRVFRGEYKSPKLIASIGRVLGIAEDGLFTQNENPPQQQGGK